MTRIAEVCINMNTNRLRNTFSYEVPEEFFFLGPGWRVVVPFGSSDAEGFVLEIKDAHDGAFIKDLKPIRDVPDEAPWFDGEMLETARWMSEYYVCALGEALRLFIPGKSGVRTQVVYQATAEEYTAADKDPVYAYILQKGPVGFDRLRAEFGARCRMELDRLVNDGYVSTCKKTGQRVALKWVKQLRLAVSSRDALEFADSLKGKPAQKKLLERLAQMGTLAISNEESGVLWNATTKALVQSGLVSMEKIRVQRDSYCGISGSCPPVSATPSQQAALDRILPSIREKKHHSFLLYGVTGSGKTEVYLQAAVGALSAGLQVLVLIPEIAQTSQLLRRFKARFGAEVAVVHSRLSLGERRDVWDHFRSRDIGIVIGTRSAMFLPADGLGLIIMDEEHEFTYKQEESPRYHVRDTLLKRAQLTGATVIFGSATPSLETYHAAMTGRYTLLEMPERVNGASLPTVEIVDMREQLKKGRKSIISEPLEKLLKDTVNKGEQSILLLNRRGHSTFILCRECGLVMRCSHCSVPLVFHMHGGRLKCHYCDASHVVPDTCPVCKSKYIRYFGAGTQRLEEELTAAIPDVRLARMDQDTTGGKGSHDRLLDGFRSGKFDILLGTQMVAKGHDIENVTSVGVLAADSSLNMPDFRAAERSFALVMQAAGRAGRGSKPGRVVIQTYNPDHYAVQTGAAQDYAAFYSQEICYRRELCYPPFAQFIKLTVTGSDEAKTMRRSEDVAAQLRAGLETSAPGVEVMGPYVAPVSKIGDIFRVHMLLRGADMKSTKRLLVDTGIAWARDIMVDVDPLGMM